MVFIKKIVLLFVPIIVFLCIPVAIFYVSSELKSVDAIAQMQWMQQQSGHYTRFGSAYIRPELYYKLASTLLRKPEVLIIGTSRVLQVRQEFFNNGVSFYNAGKGIGQLADLNYFLGAIPESKTPKTIILGLDQNFFNDQWVDENAHLSEADKYKGDNALTFLLENTKRVYLNLAKKRIVLSQITHHSAGEIGLASIIKHVGYRNDGSYYFGNVVEHDGLRNSAAFDYGFAFTMKQIHESKGQFVHANQVSKSSMDALESFLKKAHERNIAVVIFLPPYPPSIYAEIKKHAADYQYLADLPIALQSLFKRYNVSWYDYSDGARYGCTDFEASDGIHASEKCYARIFQDMAQKDSTISMYVSTTTLKKAITESDNDQQVFSL